MMGRHKFVPQQIIINRNGDSFYDDEERKPVYVKIGRITNPIYKRYDISRIKQMLEKKDVQTFDEHYFAGNLVGVSYQEKKVTR